MLSARRASGGRVDALVTLFLAFMGSALLAAVSFTTPASAFVSTPQPPSSSSSRAVKHARRAAPLFGIKRKVKAEMETNFSGKVVEQAGAETSLFGSDANALFDVIEKNKKKAAEAAAALAAGDEDEDEEAGDGVEGGNANGAGESGEAA